MRQIIEQENTNKMENEQEFSSIWITENDRFHYQPSEEKDSFCNEFSFIPFSTNEDQMKSVFEDNFKRNEQIDGSFGMLDWPDTPINQDDSNLKFVKSQGMRQLSADSDIVQGSTRDVSFWEERVDPISSQNENIENLAPLLQIDAEQHNENSPNHEENLFPNTPIKYQMYNTLDQFFYLSDQVSAPWEYFVDSPVKPFIISQHIQIDPSPMLDLFTKEEIDQSQKFLKKFQKENQTLIDPNSSDCPFGPGDQYTDCLKYQLFFKDQEIMCSQQIIHHEEHIKKNQTSLQKLFFNNV